MKDLVSTVAIASTIFGDDLVNFGVVLADELNGHRRLPYSIVTNLTGVTSRLKGIVDLFQPGPLTALLATAG